jgi:hypothetical protein
VATSSYTGQIGALTSEFTSRLLPCLNSPDDQHPHLVVEQAGPGLAQPGLQVGPPVGRDRGQGQVDLP